MTETTRVWLLLLVFHGCHQGTTTRADTCCKFNRSHSTYSCQGCKLTEVPNDIPDDVLTLDLSNNNLTIINNLTFSNLHKLKMLYLNNNQIRYFGQDALQELINLKELDIRRNQLCINDTNFNGMFNHTPHLRTLQLVNNRCKKTLSSYIDVALGPLKELEKLSLHYVKDASLGPTFGDLTALKYLMLIGSNTNGGTLGCNAFKALENVSLEMLSVRNSSINKICSTALNPLKDLKYLNLGCNADLLYDDVIEAVNNLAASTLDTIVMDRVGAGQLSIETNQKPLSPTAWKNVRKLSARFLNTAYITVTDLDFFYNLPELRYVGLPANMIWFDYFTILKGIIQYFNIAKIETVDMGHYGGQGYSEDEFYSQYCYPDNIHDEPDLFFHKPPDDIFPPIAPQKNDFDPNVTFNEGQFLLRNLPLSLQYLYVDHFTFGIIDIFQFKFNPVNQAVLFDISNSNFFGRLRSLNNMTNLQVVDARNCGFNNLDRKPLHYPSLGKLLLGGNNLKNIGSNKVKWSPFQELQKLRHIDLDDNKINFIKSNAFKNLPLLEEIKLGKNHLTVLNLDLTGSPRVRFIDVSQNMITSVTDSFMQSIDHIAKNSTISLDLTDNALDCDCTSLPFVNWFQQTHVQIVNFSDITCRDGTAIHGINTSKMAFTCFMNRTHLTVILSTVIPTAFVVFMVALLYRKRWKIQFHYYLLKDRLQRGRMLSSSLSENDDYRGILQSRKIAKNVFISCSDQDSDWLYEEVVSRIEEHWGFTTFSRKRDTDIGDDPCTLTVAALNSAAIRMCIISPNFCEDGICLWELEMILAKGEESILFFYKDEIDPTTYSYISKITQHYNHLEHGCGEEERQLCWDKLKQIIDQALANARNTSSA